MKLFLAYIRERQKEIIALVLFGAIFVVSFFLYHLPIEAVGYPALLCLLVGMIFVIIDFIHVRARHEELCGIREMTAAMISQMPAAEGIEDADYQAVIENLITEVTSLQTDTDARYQDMVEYYTVWVHQIKTPIASMRLTLQNEDSELSRKLSSDLFRIEQYVEMVLAFLRLGANSSDYVFKEYELDDIIRQAVRRFSAEFIGRKLRLEYEPLHKSIVTDDKWLSFVVE
ncbi:MAG: sensor histidine kinase, partial [Lachnospiraceae bacterium]|nr:sensor histidine kinase [Lachnospiraceae bacterium]